MNPTLGQRVAIFYSFVPWILVRKLERAGGGGAARERERERARARARARERKSARASDFTVLTATQDDMLCTCRASKTGMKNIITWLQHALLARRHSLGSLSLADSHSLARSLARSLALSLSRSLSSLSNLRAGTRLARHGGRVPVDAAAPRRSYGCDCCLYGMSQPCRREHRDLLKVE
jgi:hypothetical protein